VTKTKGSRIALRAMSDHEICSWIATFKGMNKPDLTIGYVPNTHWIRAIAAYQAELDRRAALAAR
jgi:hypothetical protein